MNQFKQLVIDDVLYNMENKIEGIKYPFPSISKYLNYIMPGEYIAVGGRPMSGKGSFVDYVFVINAYLEWKKSDPTTRKPFQIIYFGLKEKSFKKKLKRWLCTYLKLEKSTFMDINTLNCNSVGKLYDLRDTETCAAEIQAISDSEEFFNEFLEHVEFHGGQRSPSGIKKIVEKHMKSIGNLKTSKSEGYLYKLDEENEGQLTLVIVEDISRLNTESNDFAMMGEQELIKKFDETMRFLRDVYNVSPIITVPSKPTLSKNPKDSEPSYKDMGIFAGTTDKALVIYNPYNENQTVYQRLCVSDFDIGDYNKLRTLYIARNVGGTNNIEKGMIFLQGPGWFREIPNDPTELENLLEKYHRIASLLSI